MYLVTANAGLDGRHPGDWCPRPSSFFIVCG